jgi:hypothetical protein
MVISIKNPTHRHPGGDAKSIAKTSGIYKRATGLCPVTQWIPLVSAKPDGFASGMTES